jgi:hypothetical protein
MKNKTLLECVIPRARICFLVISFIIIGRGIRELLMNYNIDNFMAKLFILSFTPIPVINVSFIGGIILMCTSFFLIAFTEYVFDNLR